MKRTVFTIWAAIAACCTLHAQNQVRGRVLNADREAVPEAVVTAMQAEDRQVISSTRTDSAGVFTLAGVPGRFLLDVAAFGYEGYTQEVQAADYTGKVPDVTLAYITLDEATVTARARPRMVREGNKVVIDHLDNSPHAQGSDMYSFMRYIPLLKVPLLNGEITLRETGGGCATLLVNGKPVHIPMEAYLKNTHVENIERIEVVAHPMGEYKVEGNCGVINLIMKKREDEGVQYNLFAGDMQNGVNSQNGTFSINYTHKKAFISSGVYASNTNSKWERTTDYRYYDTGRQTWEENVSRYKDLSFTGYFNMDYELNKRHTVGVQVYAGGNRLDNSSTDNAVYRAYGTAGADSAYLSTGKAYNPDKFNYMSTNLNYTLKVDDKGSMLYADADYRMTRPETYTHNTYDKTDGEGELVSQTDVMQKTKTHIDTYGIWLRYIHVFKPGTKLISGLSYYASNTRYGYSYENLENGRYENDLNRSNRFDFDDRTLSAYATLQHQWNERLNISLGLALQVYGADGEQKSTGEKVSRDETNLLPSFNLSYRPNDNHYISVDLSNRLMQPGYFDLNPFRTYTTATSYTAGNPGIQSQRFYDGSIYYEFLEDYSFSADVSYCPHATASLKLPDADGLTVTMPTDRGKFMYNSYKLAVDKSLFSNLLTFNSEVDYGICVLKNKLPGMKHKQTSTNWNMNAGVSISLPSQCSLSTHYGFSSSSDDISQSLPDRHVLDFLAMKRFKHSNLIIGVRKFFRKNDKDIYYEQENYAYYTTLKNYWLVQASFSITFGNKRTRRVWDRSNSTVKSRTRQSEQKGL